MRQGGDFAVEPKVDAGDGRMLERGRRQAHRRQPLEGQRGDVEIGRAPLARHHEAARVDSFHRRAKMHAHGRQALPGIGSSRVRPAAPRARPFRKRRRAPETPARAPGSRARAAMRSRSSLIALDQHLAPEAVDGARRLPLLQQPVAHADPVQILAPRIPRSIRGESPTARARCPACRAGPDISSSGMSR